MTVFIFEDILHGRHVNCQELPTDFELHERKYNKVLALAQSVPAVIFRYVLALKSSHLILESTQCKQASV